MSDWRDVHVQLRSVAVRRAGLDVEEARLLREAERLQIWIPLGMVSAFDYMERVLGYAPHAASERLRVARALGSLPLIEAALGDGRLNFSGVRELTRVAVPATEAAWRDAAIGKNVRQIEELVAGHAPGDHPDDPANAEVRRHKVTLDLSAEVFARWRQAQTTMADERGARLDDDAFVIALLESTLDRSGEPTGRAKFQIMMTLCRECDRGWQEGGGVQVPVDAATVERAKCDAQYVGSTDDEVPVRASQDIPPSVVRFIWRRDGGRCTTPGCRSTVGLEIHHDIPRSQGGTHATSNLRLKCWGCHSGTHRGTLVVVDGEVRRPNEPSHVGPPASDVAAPAIDTVQSHVGPTSFEIATPSVAEIQSHVGPTSFDIATPSTSSVAEIQSHVGPTSFDIAARRTQARDALVGLGWKPGIARAAVGEAESHVRRDAPLEALIFEALRCCPRAG